MSEVLDVLRTEQKYLLNPQEYLHLRYLLGNALRRDLHGTDQGYMVRSLYFDTIDNLDFWEKAEGLESRRKIRLRVYSPKDTTAKLELKEKQGDLQRKRSLTLTKTQAQRLTLGEYQVLLEIDNPFALELYGRMQQYHYLPKCIVEYDRLAFAVDTNNTRITLDSNLRASESNLDLFEESLPLYPVGSLSAATLEIKFDHFLMSYIKDLTSVTSRTRCSVSKYYAARNITLRADF